MADFFSIFRWWSLFFIIGLAFFPITSHIFSPLIDKGYTFAKILGILIISYVIFVLGMGVIPFTQMWSITLAFLTAAGFFFFGIKKISLRELVKQQSKIIIIEELFFFLGLYFWSTVRAFQPDIYGLEKYMDFGFVNSILRATYFPPTDMWFPPFSINYYYFGHLYTAILTRISGLPSAVTYNLMIATLFACCFTLSFSLIRNLLFLIQKPEKKISRKKSFFHFFVSLITASFVALGGNLHIIYMFFLPYNVDHPVPFTALKLALGSTPNSYWYPNATRFIYNTIHEFPIYSFVVSDLHGHVSSIPIILTIIALLLVIYVKGKTTLSYLVLLSFLLATAYMTNAWDGAIYLLLSISVIVTVEIQHAWHQKKQQKSLVHFFTNSVLKPSFIIDVLYYSMIVIAGFFIFALPFSIHFKPFVGGIGVLCAPSFLTHLQRIGPFLFEIDHCQKSPLWQLAMLHGFYYFFIFSFIIFLTRTKKLLPIDIFVLLIITLGTMLIILPEFIYLKDIYPAHYRANTMFKLVYQSFMMLSLVSGYAYFRIASSLQNSKLLGKISIGCFLIVTFIFSSLILYYPVMAIRSYYNELTTYKGLDGTTYLENLHPDDYAAIGWINKTIKDQPVIIEAQGDSYTDYERISANTGLPTILGWTVHEWLWRGTYDIPAPRISEVQTVYETTDVTQLKQILRKYKVSYIYVGDLERQKYTKLTEDTFRQISRVVYQHGNTRIYQVIGS